MLDHVRGDNVPGSWNHTTKEAQSPCDFAEQNRHTSAHALVKEKSTFNLV